jgi:tetratricopeptide (TPR) repeat protein
MSHIDHAVPAADDVAAGTAIFLEAAPGAARLAALGRWVEQARASGRRALRIAGSVESDGVWTGLEQLLWSVLPDIRVQAPELIERHAYELCLVLPALRREVQLRNPCLTDVASPEEKVRNYPNDRAYRSLHGIVELLDEWIVAAPGGGCAIAIDAFDACTPLVWRFYAELLRRRGKQLNLTLLLAVSPGDGSGASDLFDPRAVADRVQLDLPSDPDQPISPAEAGARAAELEARVGDDRIEWSLHIPRLVDLWRRSDTPERAWLWQVRAINVYDHAGLYESAVRFAPALEAELDAIHANDPDLHALAVLNLFFCFAALGQPERGFDLLVTQGLPKVTDPEILVDLHYFMGMLFARFLPRRDLDRANDHLARALELLPTLEVSEARRHFLHVFMRNGLAYVRFREGQADAALELCDSGLRELDVALKPGEHQLHRSVLHYNAAQVLAALGRTEAAIAQLSRAMELDPNYSEYYLERGGLLLKLERFDAAERDLLRAIDLSPPYAEVWTDLGQTYRAAGRLAEAEDAYSRALDLDPRVGLALTGRAEARFERGLLDLACADYSAALDLDPAQPLLLAARAVAHFEAGRPAEALADLDDAIQLDSSVAELYQNRATALLAVGRGVDARRDLLTYLQLRPDADDRPDVENQLLHLAA